MKVTQRKLDTIKPYPLNPRRITDAAVTAVAKSLKDFGWRQPIVVDAQGVIIVGHTRFLAAKSLGMKTAPVHVMDVTDDQAKAYRLADNKTGEQVAWDVQLLAEELESGLESAGDDDLRLRGVRRHSPAGERDADDDGGSGTRSAASASSTC